MTITAATNRISYRLRAQTSRRLLARDFRMSWTGGRSNEADDAAIDMKPKPELSAQEVLAGLIERVTYHNTENGFWVLRARRAGMAMG